VNEARSRPEGPSTGAAKSYKDAIKTDLWDVVLDAGYLLLLWMTRQNQFLFQDPLSVVAAPQNKFI